MPLIPASRLGRRLPSSALLAITFVALGTPARADLGILVPAYFYPTNNNVHWNALDTAAADVPLTAIMNPNSGPGTGIDSNYVNVVDSLRAAGGTVIAYVRTNWGNQPLATVQNEINDYLNWYNIDGIFLDEMSTASGDLNYYESIYNFTKNINPNWQVVGNPGINTLETYASRPTADVLVVTEQTGALHNTYTPSAWNANYPSDRFAHLVHTQPTQAGMLANLDQSVSQNAGMIYITDDVLNNPWDRLPTYWNAQVARVKEINDGGVVIPPIKPGGLETRYNPVPNNAINVNDTPGNRNGWANVESFSDDPANDAGPQVDFTGLTAAHDDDTLFFRIERDPASANPLDFNQNIFIDADQDRTTGFIGGGGFLPIGVDFLLQGSTLYSFANGANQQAWGWNSLAAISHDDNPTTDIELALARSLLGSPVAIDLLLNAANTGAGSIEDNYPDASDYFTYAFIPLTDGITGDFNNSGQVEQGDLDLVLQNWGTDTTSTGTPNGWTNDNTDLGQIEQTELDRVLQNWGSTTAPDFTRSAVPEPTALALLSLATLATLRRR